MRKRRTPAQRAEKTLRPVHANAGIEAEYRKRLDALIEKMEASTLYFVTAAYRQNTPRIAQDRSPADVLRGVVAALAKRWMHNFDDAAPKLAEWFGQATSKRSTDALRKILKDGGISVEFKITPAMRDILDATVNQNVALIKTIPQQYFSEIEGLVMRSVQVGGDLGTLTAAIKDRYGVTKRRAAFIARDQNSKANAAMTRARQMEAGIDEAIWLHSGGGKHPRPSHAKAGRDKARFPIAEGWHDPEEGRNIWPGELINCRCVSKSVVPGFR